MWGGGRNNVVAQVTKVRKRGKVRAWRLFEHLLQFVSQVVGFQAPCHHLSAGVHDDVVGHGLHADFLQKRAVENHFVTHGGPWQRVVFHKPHALLPAGVYADAEHGEFLPVFVFQHFESSLVVLAFKAPRCPHVDDGDLSVQVVAGEPPALHVGCREGRNLHARPGHAERFQFLLQPCQLSVLGLLVHHFCGQLQGFPVVGVGGLHEIPPQEERAHRRLRVFSDEVLGGFCGLWRRCVGNGFPERRHQLVVVGSLHGHFLEVRGVGLHLHGGFRLGEDGLFREVGKHNHEHPRPCAVHGVREPSSRHLDGVHAVDQSVEAIDIELTLVQVEEPSFDLKPVSGGSARSQNQGDDEQGENFPHDGVEDVSPVAFITCSLWPAQGPERRSWQGWD